MFISKSYSFLLICVPLMSRSSNDDEGRAAGQFWTTMDEFPRATMTPYYLHGDGTASVEAPTTEATPSTSYVYDPTDVIATNGGNNLFSDAPCGKWRATFVR